MRDAVHRTIMVVDIAESSRPVRTNDDQLVIRTAMYDALATAFGRHDWQRCRWEDRGDGVLILVPPEIPKARLVTGLPERLEAALGRHNSAMEERSGERAAATQVRLRVAVHAGEVTFDKHGVVGAAINHTFRLVDAPSLKAALAGSLDACALLVSDWFYSEVVYHCQDARPDSYRQIGYEVKGTWLSAWMRVLNSRLTLESSDQDLAEQKPAAG
jgi:class 3 adenylate cyclase